MNVVLGGRRNSQLNPTSRFEIQERKVGSEEASAILSQSELDSLRALSLSVRRDCINMISLAKSGHIGASFSIVDVLVVLYSYFIRRSPKFGKFCLSKGHGAPALYAVLKHFGFLPHDLDWGREFRTVDGVLQGHPYICTNGVDCSSGSLGMGLSAGIGMAIASRLAGEDESVFVLLGDGELNEGQIWEAMMTAAKYKLGNLIAIVDNNHSQCSGSVAEVMPLANMVDRWNSFGWRVLTSDGHNYEELKSAFSDAIKPSNIPSVIIADTVKNYGLPSVAGSLDIYGESLTDEIVKKFLEELSI